MTEETDRVETGAAPRDLGKASGDLPAAAPSASHRIASTMVVASQIILVIVTIPAGLGVFANGLGESVLTFAWWYYGISAFVQTIVALVRARTRPHDRRPNRGGDLGYPHAVRVYRYLLSAAVVALAVGGHYQLAALLIYLICLGIARRVENRRILGELKHTNPVSRGIHAVIFTAAVGVAWLLAPVVRPVFRFMARPAADRTPLFVFVLLLPFILIYGLFLIPCMAVKATVDWFRTRRGDRAMIECLREGGTLAYFVYAEPHQREHFLGENGVLKPLADRVLARDWRVDLEPVRVAAYAGKGEGVDAMFLRRFRLTKLKDDLPFVAVLAAGGKVRPFYCSGPYRQRRRDGGVALIRIEDDIRSVLEKHVAKLAAAV